ncbi:unnamed protein product [marine sediment metagenome]|uniref:Uncharacterized protein n=1 Tax=marine sediment metagenome TaxID=412755 RepID=X0VSL9_9ZZZZ
MLKQTVKGHNKMPNENNHDGMIESQRLAVNQQLAIEGQAHNHWARAEELKQNYLRILIEARLKSAKANLIDAEVYKQHDKAKVRSELIKQLHISLKRMQSDIYKNRKRIAFLQKMERYLSLISRGPRMGWATLCNMWQGFNHLLGECPLSILSELMTTSAKCGTGNENGFKLIHVIEKYRNPIQALPEMTTEMYYDLVRAFSMVQDYPKQKCQMLAEASQKIQQGVFDVWNPSVMLSEISGDRMIEL